MDKEQFTWKDYLESKEHFYKVLKGGYLELVNQASDKEYAKSYYRKIIFEKNEQIPYYTMFFDNLICTFTHFEKLNKPTAIDETLNLVETFKEEISNLLKRIKYRKDQDGLVYVRLETLPEHYKFLLQEKDIKLSEIILLETQVIEKTTKENALAMLALHRACEELLIEFEEKETLPLDVETESEEEEQVGRFTTAQTSIIMYLLVTSYGKEVKLNTNLSKLAQFIHSITGKPFTKAPYSEYYHKLREYSNHKTTSQTIKNLQAIRPYFVELHLTEIIKVIDEQINSFQSK